MKEKIKDNYYIVIATGILLIFVAQLLYTGMFSHPAVDDYNYSIYTFNALKTGGILKLLAGIGKTVSEFYMTWQGTYSAIVIMALEPAIWGQQFYFVGSFILIFSLLFSTSYLLKQLLKNYYILTKNIPI